MSFFKKALEKLDFGGGAASLATCLNLEEKEDGSAAVAGGSAGSSGSAVDSTTSASSTAAGSGDGVAVTQQLNKTVMKLYGQFLSDDGSRVDYDGLAQSPVFNDEFLSGVRGLTLIDVAALDGPARTALWLNVYNVLEIHSTVASRRLADDASARAAFKKKACYCVTPDRLLYTLADIEHGCLRGNRRPPYVPFRRLGTSSDLRLRTVCSPVDPRIHFALNCGAQSCPPIRFFSVDNLDRALHLATAAFCASPSNVAVAGSQISLSQIWRWYSGDFGVTATDFKCEPVISFIVAHLPADSDLSQQLQALQKRGSWSITWLKYNWSPNSL